MTSFDSHLQTDLLEMLHNLSLIGNFKKWFRKDVPVGNIHRLNDCFRLRIGSGVYFHFIHVTINYTIITAEL